MCLGISDLLKNRSQESVFRSQNERRLFFVVFWRLIFEVMAEAPCSCLLFSNKTVF